ncbi:hypothetical protein R5R35_001593 [Gryllus longicercus]
MLDEPPRPDTPPAPARDSDDDDDGGDGGGEYDGDRQRFRTYQHHAPPPPPSAPVVLPPFVRVNPHPLGQPDGPDYLPVDHNLPQLLRQVTGTDDLAAVQSVRVRVVARETSLQRLCLYMPHLRELYLDGSRLGSLRDLGCGLSSLEVLSVGNCGLDSLDGTFGLMTLKELYAVDNTIDDVSMCTSLPNIRVIDLKRNIVQDIGYIGFLSICTDLRKLSLAGCPVSRLPGYRNALIEMLPQLQSLDGVPVEEESEEEGFFDDGGDDVDEESENVYPRANEGEAPSVNGSASGEDLNDSMFNNANSSGDNSLKQLSDLSRHMSEENSAHDDSSTSSGYVATRRMPFVERRASTPLPKTVKKMVQSARASAAFGKIGLGECSGKKRPSTASTSASSISLDEGCEPPVPLLRTDAPSLLTSGTVMCGNLASALRARRNRASAWAEALAEEDESDGAKDVRRHASSDSLCGPEAPADESAQMSDDCDAEKENDYTPTNKNLLEKSRRWREIFRNYRTQHRDKWEKEKEDDESNDEYKNQEEDKKKESTEENEPSIDKELKIESKREEKKTERSNIPPCCAMMHMLRMNENKGNLYPSNTPVSASQQENRSGTKGHEFMKF